MTLRKKTNLLFLQIGQGRQEVFHIDLDLIRDNKLTLWNEATFRCYNAKHGTRLVVWIYAHMELLLGKKRKTATDAH